MELIFNFQSGTFAGMIETRALRYKLFFDKGLTKWLND